MSGFAGEAITNYFVYRRRGIAAFIKRVCGARIEYVFLERAEVEKQTTGRLQEERVIFSGTGA